MKTEKEMLDLIFTFAFERDDIRAIYLNGSRANPNVKKDIFQDYDIVYVVKNTEPFINDKEWISLFGTILISQETNLDKNTWEKHYTYLIQFMDGNRIDVTFVTEDYMLETYLEDKLTVPLLDKEGILPEIMPSTDVDYHVKKPTQLSFSQCCNEFWWVSAYIAKGLWREEILYALDHLNYYVRPELLRMLAWQVGIDTHFSLSVGKNNKYLDRYLPKADWNQLLLTYPVAESEKIWEALFQAIELFKRSARRVATYFDYNYNETEEKNMMAYLSDIKALPKDALAIR